MTPRASASATKICATAANGIASSAREKPYVLTVRMTATNRNAGVKTAYTTRASALIVAWSTSPVSTALAPSAVLTASCATAPTVTLIAGVAAAAAPRPGSRAPRAATAAGARREGLAAT